MDDRSARQTRVTRHNTADTHRGKLSERQSRVFWAAASTSPHSVFSVVFLPLECCATLRLAGGRSPGRSLHLISANQPHICDFPHTAYKCEMRWGRYSNSQQQPAAPWIADISWWCDDSFRTLPTTYCLPPPVAWDGHRKIITILTVTQNILLYPHFLFLSKSGGHNFDDLPFCPFVFLGLCLNSVSMCVRNAVHNLRHW